jgi:sarcosine oxidase, subunit beta
MTPDRRPILGSAGPDGLFLAVGWSGTGFKKAPAVGAELARWISDGAPKRPELKSYRLTRFEEGAPIRGQHEYALSAPH